MRRLVAALVLLSGVGLAGCSMFSYGHFDPLATGQAFDDSQKRFNRLVRWGQRPRTAKLGVVRSSLSHECTRIDTNQADARNPFVPMSDVAALGTCAFVGGQKV